MRSASFGVYVDVGSRDEPEGLHGAAHFLEHLLFKGTTSRTAWDITSQIEAVGGETNAYTTKEYTCYYARVLDRDLPLAIDVICDMVTSSTLPESEMEIERGVVIEEIAMSADEPEDLVLDLFAASTFGEHPLGRPVHGGVATIQAMHRDALFEFYRARYQPANMVIAAAGNLSHDEVVDYVKSAFNVMRNSNVALPKNAFSQGPALTTTVHHKDTEQAHLVVGGRGINRRDERRYALNVLTQVLGGGMSSRLFQEIRERRGLAYSVYAFDNQYSDTGYLGVYAGCAPDKANEVLGVLSGQLDNVAKKGLMPQEVERGIGMLCGATVLGLEDAGSRMGRIATDELLFGEFVDIDELLRRTKNVTVDQVAALSEELLGGPRSVNVVGPITDEQL
ncbi:MAG: insulinase family protein [Corynebacteriales bacterium]|nr:insulinase family protein [Mycobacteriales bacterium]